jgi:hypothetical protein
MSFVHDLSIRKIPGIGRVNERLLESVGIKVSPISPSHCTSDQVNETRLVGIYLHIVPLSILWING